MPASVGKEHVMIDVAISRATAADAAEVARLLHAFNTEFDDPSPGEAFLKQRIAHLIAADEVFVFLVGDGPDGVAVVRLRPALWSPGLDAYLEELYVIPQRRGIGFGRALLEAVMEAARDAGAVRIELGTEEDDVEARALYESTGFANHDGHGAQMLFYERDLSQTPSRSAS
jgi:ribosomal protein S18 acetylase RimI-like enzyme